MGYLKDFLIQINNRDFRKFLVLWDEYSRSDEVEADEFIQLLKAIKSSDMAVHFGQMIESALPLWKTIQDKKESYQVLSLLIDLQTTNSPVLTDLVLETLQHFHGEDPKFNDRLRLIGLRNKDHFQGALAKYDLVCHMAKNNIVFHTGGWGTGEIVEVSFVREHLMIEFENVSGRKDLSFANAFKVLIPLPATHFLARRFTNADQLEKEGKEDPAALVKLLLKDLGPKTASEIKDELCQLVIPESEWSKWWQGARSRLKKDPFISSPDSFKEPFTLRKAQLTPQEQLKEAMHNKVDPREIILATYNFIRDTPTALKNAATKEIIQQRLLDHLSDSALSDEKKIQILFLLNQFFGYPKSEEQIASFVQSHPQIKHIIASIEIAAFKKQALLALKEYRSDWLSLFLDLLFTLPQAQLRDYLLKEINSHAEGRSILEKKMKELLESPEQQPDFFVWYFQKLIGQEERGIPYESKEGIRKFFEGFLILFSAIEGKMEERDLMKKMYNMLLTHRYALVRQMLEGTDLEYAKEFLLLASKCQALSGHDMKIFRSLAEVVHPSLAGTKPKKETENEETSEIWTTEEGYLKVQERIRQIGTIEIVENAREIEAARALGDLRENSEFKFAQERRARLQAELKTLSSQLNRARIITPQDVHSTQAGVGSVVNVVDHQGNKTSYVLLGPWDADPERNILSFNSKLAQSMSGKRIGDQFEFRNEQYKIVGLDSYFK